MDEIGRGTAILDGIAISYATLHQLHYANKCRTLFATHFHELADMINHFEHVAYYCTDIKEIEVIIISLFLCEREFSIYFIIMNRMEVFIIFTR